MPNQIVGISPGVISDKIRWLAIVAGCFSAVTGFLAFGTLFPLASSFLVLGAAIQPHSPRSGRWLMWIGALCLSSVVVPIGIGITFDGLKALYSDPDRFMIRPFSLSFVSLALVVSCDVALVMDGLMQNSNQGAELPSLRPNLNWLVWMAAIALSGYLLATSVFAIRAFHLHDRVDILLTWLTLSLVALLFDGALMFDAIKKRARRSDRRESI